MAEYPAGCHPELFQGQPCHRISLPNGDSVLVAEHGAHVLSWRASGQEQFYLSPVSLFDGQAAIRGGVPVCFPQFNMRGSLPKHGFARNLPWQLRTAACADDQAELTLRLSASEATRRFWPAAFELTLTVRLRPACLQLTLDLRNTGNKTLEFSGALHTYLRICDVAAAELQGLAGQPQWDAVADRNGHAEATLRFAGEFDRVYDAAGRGLLLQDGMRRLLVEQSASFADTVVWNPGADKCAGLADMPADGWRYMLCVEAAQVMQPAAVAPGAAWQGWQRLTLA